jgi:hypothetical protein
MSIPERYVSKIFISVWIGLGLLASLSVILADQTMAAVRTGNATVAYNRPAGRISPTGVSSQPMSGTVILDRVAPEVTVTLFGLDSTGTYTQVLPLITNQTVFTVAWTAVDRPPSSGLVPLYTVAYRVDHAPWASWFSVTPLRAMTFYSGVLGHTYTFSVTACDNAGNCGTGTQSVRLSEPRVYLPFAVRDYASLLNGDFEAGPLNEPGTVVGWQTFGGGFGGFGSTGLPQQIVSFEESRRLLLGDPFARNSAVPVGYGAVAQTFTVDTPYLDLIYQVHSYDIYEGPAGYFDTFEISINQAPPLVPDLARDTKCTLDQLNPSGVITATEGLVLCGGRSNVDAVLGQPWDSGWQTVRLDVSAFVGQNITLHLAVWNREYTSDEGWYSTWVYVDDLKLRH